MSGVMGSSRGFEVVKLRMFLSLKTDGWLMFMAFYRCREFSHKTSILELERETESGLFESVCV